MQRFFRIVARVSVAFLPCAALAGAASHAPTPEAARAAVEDALGLPEPVWAVLPLPPTSAAEREVLGRLEKSGALAPAENSYRVREADLDWLSLVRRYPSYEITGVQARLCERSVEVRSVAAEGASGAWLAVGRLLAGKRRPELEGLSPLSKNSSCADAEGKWRIVADGRGWRASEAK